MSAFSKTNTGINSVFETLIPIFGKSLKCSQMRNKCRLFLEDHNKMKGKVKIGAQVKGQSFSLYRDYLLIPRIS